MVYIISSCKFDGIRPSGFVRQIRPMRRYRFPSDRMRDYMMVLPNPIVIIEDYLALGLTGKFRSS